MDLAAIRAYAAAQGANPATGPAAAANPADGAGFEAMVREAVSSVQDTVATAENLTAQAATGQAELVDVVTAVAAAEVQLETVVAVRDQVIRAYQDILRMPI
jgi:flagellar hook-basal body complex protein FliE